MSSEASTTSPFPPVRRVVTGHTTSGRSVVLEDGPIEGKALFEGSDTAYAGLYRHDEFPASNQDAHEHGEEVPKFADCIASKPKELFSPSGSTFWAIDTAPHSKSQFHRTVTLDYAIITKGTLTLVLDDGKRLAAKEGDVVIQRGTIHEWANESDEWSRAFFVSIPAEKVKIGDKELDMDFISTNTDD
ncbi:hypothetical protein SCHPADRAFT_203691 [Schizopora paradoxa]|uniref:Cupin type-2 domain-containing protein n=1 Tax=Schizopora paradoxa TaxID=27342 RepID=A0A0H2RX97_9AGAM|nr:hypothetical protein SCHPADRAFT_203691 [Schizopora paradoxa]